MALRLSDNYWEMGSEEMKEVQRTGLLNGNRVDVSRLMWVEVAVGRWRCWILPAQ